MSLLGTLLEVNAERQGESKVCGSEDSFPVPGFLMGLTAMLDCFCKACDLMSSLAINLTLKSSIVSEQKSTRWWMPAESDILGWRIWRCGAIKDIRKVLIKKPGLIKGT